MSSWSYKFDNLFENPEEFLTNRKTAVLVSLAAVLDHPLSIRGVDDLAANSIAMTDATSSVASDLEAELEAMLAHGRWHFATAGPVSPWCLSLCL